MLLDPCAPTPPPAGVVVPIRAFTLGKGRLASELDDNARTDLARDLANRVVSAAGSLPVAVVSSADEVRAWSAAAGVTTLDDPGSLDAAARAGADWCADRGLARVVIAHADLPWARSFVGLIRDAARPIVAIVPCHRDDGTPVISLPTWTAFRFAYGPGSFRRHAAEVRRLALGLRVVRDPELAFDVDVPSDLERLRPTTLAPPS